MTSHRERNDRKSPNRGPRRGQDFRAPAADGAGWIWGWHAVEAALRNPDRPAPSLALVSADKAERLASLKPGAPLEVRDNNAIARSLPAGAVHQGVALKIPPLEGVDLATVAEPAYGFLIMLDQVTDPQNVGAIFRSAAAFGARGVILQDRHAPQLGGALAKASAGAIDKVPVVRVVNLARTLDRLTDLGWTVIGLDSESEVPLANAFDGRPAVLVMGSEGDGLRRLVGEHCDVLAKIPMPGAFESLNVSAAAAIALYEASRGTASSPVARTGLIEG